MIWCARSRRGFFGWFSARERSGFLLLISLGFRPLNNAKTTFLRVLLSMVMALCLADVSVQGRDDSRTCLSSRACTA